MNPSAALRHVARLVTLIGYCSLALTSAAPVSAAPALARPELTRPVMLLWPGSAPGSSGVELTETIMERSADPKRPDRFVTGVSRPSLTVFAPAQASGVGLIIAPGGGYVREVVDKEGSEIAAWVAARGVTAFVLKHRLPGEGHAARTDVPLQDAQRAMRLVRARAAELGVDAQRIGFMGFSAGGHVAASVATRFDVKVYEPLDKVDKQSARPDFSILIYPVISMDSSLAHVGSRKALLGDAPTDAEVASHSADQSVTAATPPTLLILADDDASVVPEHSLRYYRALHRAGVSAELHIYAAGKHGFGIRGAAGLPIGSWPDVAWTWLGASGIVRAAPR